MRFFVPGTPQGKARARTVTSNGKTHSYTPEKTVRYEADISAAFRTAYPGAKPAKGAMEIKLTAVFPVPVSWPVKKKQAALAGMLKPTVKPDCDNIVKVVADALNGLAWEDDKQIVYATIEKKYGIFQGVEVWICPIGEASEC